MFLKNLLKHGILCLAIVFQICQQRSLFFQFLSCTTGLFRTIASSGNVLKNIYASQLVHKRTEHSDVKGAGSRGHDGSIGDF